MKKLYCPVRRLDKPSVDVNVKKGRDNLININANIKIKDPVSFIIDYISKRRGK